MLKPINSAIGGGGISPLTIFCKNSIPLAPFRAAPALIIGSAQLTVRVRLADSALPAFWDKEISSKKGGGDGVPQCTEHERRMNERRHCSGRTRFVHHI